MVVLEKLYKIYNSYPFAFFLKKDSFKSEGKWKFKKKNRGKTYWQLIFTCKMGVKTNIYKKFNCIREPDCNSNKKKKSKVK